MGGAHFTVGLQGLLVYNSMNWLDEYYRSQRITIPFVFTSRVWGRWPLSHGRTLTLGKVTCSIKLQLVSLWGSSWVLSLGECCRVALSLNFLQLRGGRWNLCRKKISCKKKSPVLLSHTLFQHPLLLFFSCCRCSFRIPGSGCSPHLVCQRSLPNWDLSEEEKIQCTCPGRRFPWKLTATWTSKIARINQHSQNKLTLWKWLFNVETVLRRA